MAQYKGYFKEEGLDVQMDIGSGSAVVVQRLASGVYDMGYGDITALIEFMGQNASNPAALIQAVYIVQQETPASMVFKTRANIQSPKICPEKPWERLYLIRAESYGLCSPGRKAWTRQRSSGKVWTRPCGRRCWFAIRSMSLRAFSLQPKWQRWQPVPGLMS